MGSTRFKISNSITAPGSLISGAVEFYKDSNEVIYQFVGNMANNPVMVGTTLQSISQTIISPMSGDELTLFHSNLAIKLTRVIVVARPTSMDLNFGLYSTSDRSDPSQTQHFRINDFNSSNYPTAGTLGYRPALDANIVAANDFLTLNIISVNSPTDELFIHIDYIYLNP